MMRRIEKVAEHSVSSTNVVLRIIFSIPMIASVFISTLTPLYLMMKDLKSSISISTVPYLTKVYCARKSTQEWIVSRKPPHPCDVG